VATDAIGMGLNLWVMQWYMFLCTTETLFMLKLVLAWTLIANWVRQRKRCSCFFFKLFIMICEINKWMPISVLLYSSCMIAVTEFLYDYMIFITKGIRFSQREVNGSSKCAICSSYNL
jgi:hypothetical protein